MQETIADQWQGLYSESWQGVIVKEAFAHPAKYARALIRRIYEHLRCAKRIAPGMTVLDPFGGVALGALDAMFHGLRYIGVELEKTFHILGRRNIYNWVQKWVCTCHANPTYLRELQQSLYERTGRSESETETEDGAVLFQELPEHLFMQGQEMDGKTEGEIKGPNSLEQGAELVRKNEKKTVKAGQQRGKGNGEKRELEGGKESQEGRLHRNLDRQSPSKDGACLSDGTTSGATDERRRGRSSQKRKSTRQQIGKSGSNDHQRTHAASSSQGDNQEPESSSLPNLRDGVCNNQRQDLFREMPVGEGTAILEEVRGQESEAENRNDMRLLRGETNNIPAQGCEIQEVQKIQVPTGVQPPLEKIGTRCNQCGKLITPLPTLLHGDSRQLCSVVKEANCIVSSPPYAETLNTKNDGIDWEKTHHGSWEKKHGKNGKCSYAKNEHDYGTTPGQLGSMKPGDVAAVISSPSWEESLDRGVVNRAERIELARSLGIPSQCTSPIDMEKIGKRTQEYGKSTGQLGNTTGETFWEASLQIVSQCYQLLKPGGVSCWVVKAFVRKGKIVDFPGQWLALCQSVGFKHLHTHHAMLVTDAGEQGMLFGEPEKLRKEKKSFFRRLSEKRGSPKIDWEVVLCLEK